MSTRNATFQYWETLLGNRTKRNRAGEMIVQGVRPINLALESELQLRAVLITHADGRSRWASETSATAERGGAEPYLVAPELMVELGEKGDEPPELLLIVAIPADDLSRLPTPANASMSLSTARPPPAISARSCALSMLSAVTASSSPDTLPTPMTRKRCALRPDRRS
ncbi:hypothetical protein [Microbacterium sp. CH12i]|uniref:hypothetical protein n=1 Tax=Microbacterium sp. CH12i TaxID=1479651 RepID=UPI002E148B2A